MKEEKLIFLISQPRSGSTLTQKILGAHSKIYTRSEPWLMLPPAYTLKDHGIYSEYNFEIERIAFNGFLGDLPKGKDTYIKELREMYLNLYSYYLDNTDYSYFLDKTPRYYLIVDELLQIFPKAKFIVLIRNPLAVLGSMITSWTKTNWFKLSDYKHDLTKAIDVNVAGIGDAKENCLVIHYEELLAENDQTLKDIFLHLGVDFEDDVLDYHTNNEKWALGDPVNVNSKKGIDKSNDDKWVKGLVDPQYWRVMYDYLQYIGPDKFNILGYDFAKHMALLTNNMPTETLAELNAKTFSLFSFLDDTRECLINNKVQQQTISQKTKELQEKQQTISQKTKELQEKQQTISQKTKELQEKQQTISQKTKELQEKQQTIEKINSELAINRSIIEKKEQEINDIYASKRWRLIQRMADMFLPKKVNK